MSDAYRLEITSLKSRDGILCSGPSDFARNASDRSRVLPSLALDRHSETRFVADLDESGTRSDRAFQHRRPVPFIETLATLLYPHVRR